MKTDFNEAYQQAQVELASKLIEQAQLEQEIAKLRQFIGSMETNLADSIQVNKQDSKITIGLKEACLQVLKATGKPMTASEVAQLLVFTGLDMSSYTNVIAPVTTTLKRLAANGEIEASEYAGRPTYQWSYEAMVKRFTRMQEFVKKQMNKKP